MRYLKEFKEKTKRLNESHTDDTIENVKDILLPISDMGYDISVTEDESQYAKSNQQSILIIKVRKRHSIYPLFVTYVNNPLLITDEVKEEFIRMSDKIGKEFKLKQVNSSQHIECSLKLNHQANLQSYLHQKQVHNQKIYC